MPADTIAAVYAVFGSDEEARRIAREMVEARLAACVNILGPCRSIYRWQNAIEEANEAAAVFKTARAKIEPLIAAIRAAHSYETPAIVAFAIEGTDSTYRDWIMMETGAKSA